jgi:uncharacterized protein YcaQ
MRTLLSHVRNPTVSVRLLRLSSMPVDLSTREISASQARRIALAAQGFASPRPTGPITKRNLRQVIDRLSVLQLDSVNVFCRTHYMPHFSRLGPYPRELLDELALHLRAEPRRTTTKRELFEYWAHEASLVKVELHPMLRWRMATPHAWGGVARIEHDNPDLVDQVRAHVRDDGPIRASDVDVERPAREPGSMWSWHEGKTALEYLFWSGEVSASSRVNFERRYDLTERVLPDAVLKTPTPTPHHAHQELIRRAARAYGIGTEPDLRDYFRLSPADSIAAVSALVESGELLPVRVAGWRQPAYLSADARVPRRVNARALLSPFDPLVWFRPRTERLFAFEYRIEIYVPAPKRVYGYYVLPFLLGEHLVGRVDLKSDRQAGVLRVQAAHIEDGQDRQYVAAELAEELKITADWLDLSGVEVMNSGEFSRVLARYF